MLHAHQTCSTHIVPYSVVCASWDVHYISSHGVKQSLAAMCSLADINSWFTQLCISEFERTVFAVSGIYDHIMYVLATACTQHFETCSGTTVL